MLRWQLVKAGFEPFEARLEVGAPAAAAGRPDTEARPYPPAARPATACAAPCSCLAVATWRRPSVTTGSICTEVRTGISRSSSCAVAMRSRRSGPSWNARRPPSSAAWDAPLNSAIARAGRVHRRGSWAAYPEGRGDYPVSGVSWFEAVAVLRLDAQESFPACFTGARHLARTYFMEVVTLGNFDGRGPVEVTKAEGPWAAWHVRNGGQCQRVGVERVPGPEVHPWRRMERTGLPGDGERCPAAARSRRDKRLQMCKGRRTVRRVCVRPVGGAGSCPRGEPAEACLR